MTTMKNPFPGMNPYLEGDDWHDLHNMLAAKISEVIIPKLVPKYKAVIEKYVVKKDITTTDLNIFYPDVAVVHNEVLEPAAAYENAPQLTKSNLTIPTPLPVEIKIPYIEIRDVKNRKLITIIEILSPANKSGIGFQQYKEKQQQLFQADVHLLEIDLLRGGQRTFPHPDAVNADYLIALTRNGQQKTELWTIDLTEKLPNIPIPLLPEDNDLILNLQNLVDTLFEQRCYGEYLDYSQMPPLPKLSKDKRKWLESVIQ